MFFVWTEKCFLLAAKKKKVGSERRLNVKPKMSGACISNPKRAASPYTLTLKGHVMDVFRGIPGIDEAKGSNCNWGRQPPVWYKTGVAPTDK